MSSAISGTSSATIAGPESMTRLIPSKTSISAPWQSILTTNFSPRPARYPSSVTASASYGEYPPCFGVYVAVFGVGRIAKDAQRPGRAGHRLFFERGDAVHPVELEVERRELAGPQSNACILLDLPRCLTKAASSTDRRPYWHPTSTRRSGPPSQRHSMAFLSAEGMSQTLPGAGADGFLPEAMSRSWDFNG